MDGFTNFLSGNPILLLKTLGFRRTGSRSGEAKFVQTVDLRTVSKMVDSVRTQPEIQNLYYTTPTPNLTICSSNNMDSLAVIIWHNHENAPHRKEELHTCSRE